MEIIDDKNENDKNNSFYENKWQYRQPRSGRVMAGLILVVVGAIFLAKEMGIPFPEWLFSWPMLLIVIGLYSGAKHNFCRGGWFVPIIIGGIFLIDYIFPDISIRPMVWPIVIIIIGIVMILRPRRNHYDHWRKWKNKDWQQHEFYAKSTRDNSTENTINTVSVFGGVKKNIISKDFKGGEVICIFGGAEIDLSQADINGKINLELIQIFGGTKLIVPAHWEIQSEVVAILGGIEDKRPVQKPISSGQEKILVLRGTTIFGGLDIKSY